MTEYKCWRERLVVKIRLINVTLYYNLGGALICMDYLVMNIPCSILDYIVIYGDKMTDITIMDLIGGYQFFEKTEISTCESNVFHQANILVSQINKMNMENKTYFFVIDNKY
ncbi:hypothetical protein Kpol_304p1 [Vanderwaltozyma polyspora DSM 70294]|uniref:Uncharacterized protein n=1 Tax=Vanderwaltozyma polyspora (strain ATCC 22028 / DSM 70294 / BCRC 21397 / CBS 2163 / NBRC 10782 / NRRL Y-8283 / UCD 57-17) TaxID=436907 RepID=A7TSZ3_VANPO|nr:uncharacterized protein Kpol_389p1 [Vanderwaltozyma polyspora DSM 70294]XP_001642467.1 uncharacterized protein Kpol_304p1 [Vanderwaltozyma polyspora DSM 70294]EDO14340.1 hypothetical protein Kpol_389p1 [Vanderwaltozyma polyspora DSM 70294]EDO14609.1 hypothetical protein Kpol_304p1 [Vanderwaltozyma polyspora DSM 70294]